MLRMSGSHSYSQLFPSQATTEVRVARKKKKPFSIIHSLVHFPLALLMHSGLWGFRSLSLLSPGRRWAYTLDMSLVYCRATQKEKQPFTPELKDKLEFALRLMIMFLGCARKPENLKRSHAQHGEKIPAPHRKATQAWNPNPILLAVRQHIHH